VKQGIMVWIVNWKRNGWKTAAGTAVKNKELWIKIDEARKKLKIVEWRWVKAHNGNLKNEEVDKLARLSAETIKKNIASQ
jgi:ribonuclease HI